MGMLGLYDPDEAWVFPQPAYRLIVGEAQINFRSYAEIYHDLYQGSEVLDWVYTEDGLVCGYHIERPKDSTQFNVYEVELYQYYIQGKKPVGLRGARSSAIHLEQTRLN
jgi:hypothetical protein